MLYREVTQLYICILFHILFHYGLSEDTEYSSPYYTAGPCLSILCSLYLLIPNSQSFLPSPIPATTNLFSVSVRLFLRYVHLCHVLILFTHFIYFWLCWVFITAWALLYLWCAGFSLRGFLLVWGFPEAQMVKNLPALWEIWVRSLDWDDPLEKGMATHSSILAWRIPWTEEPAGYSPWGPKELDMTEQLTLSLSPGVAHRLCKSVQF